MKRLLLTTALAAAATTALSADFSAADVPAIGLRQSGKILIRNHGNTITAYRFFGNIREALLTLRSVHTLHTNAYGSVLFDSSTHVTQMPAMYSSLIEEAGRAHGVDPRLVAAVAGRESAYNPNAVSAVGACGLMQLMPATARFLGVTDIFDARANIFAGTRYLRTLLDTFHGDLDLALAAYNAGPGAVQKYNGVPPYRETQQYVKIVRASYEKSLIR